MAEMFWIAIIFMILVNSYSFKVEVEVKEGTIIGKTKLTIFDERLYYAFYAIPYARPPVDKLRFKDPVPFKKWEDKLDATKEFYGYCAQPQIVYKKALVGGEDCLHINIFTPILPKYSKNLKTVVVWVHGHVFTTSFSHIHGPDSFIDNDVVVVTLTHRIGAFGFLKLNNNNHHANMGLKDIVMALRWIRRNIEQFSGDKNNVVLMGGGSGATYLSLLLTTKYKGLFSKLILQSGSIFSPSLFQTNNEMEYERLKLNLHQKGINDILKASTKDITTALNKIYRNSEVINSQLPLIPFLPTIETKSNKSLVHYDPNSFYANVKNINRINKPILIGYNSMESISEAIPFLHNPHLLMRLTNQFKYLVPFASKCRYNYNSTKYKQIAEEILRQYFKGNVSDKSVENYLRYSSDLILYPIFRFIQEHLKLTFGKMYVYKFDYVGNFSVVKANAIAGSKTKVKGASAGDEVCYVFNCEPILDYYVKTKATKDKDYHFIKLITELWTNFAKTGDPTPNTYKGNVTWPPMSLTDDNVFYLGKANIVIGSKKEKRMYSFWNDIYHRYYEHCDIHDEL